MGSTNFSSKLKNNGIKSRSSSIGSEKDLATKLRRTKIRRSGKMPDYGGKRIPDYTELAYKEAVAKLRYFLAGNYSPSVRSYGGGSVSIKNLDESDGDIDKKYATYTSALAEYKPRTRLSAKYATLYADSLKNYSPVINHGSTSFQAPPPAPGDLTAGTNPDVINFIQKQEEYIEQLERESQYCREELNGLLGKVKEVITENEHLHELQKSQLISKMFTCTPDSETDDAEEQNDSAGRDSEAKISRSVRRVRQSAKLEGPNIVFESRISELEAQLMQAKIALKKVQEENDENKRKLAAGLVDSTCLDGFKRQIDNLQRDKSSLEAQLTKLKVSLDQKDSELDPRYKRGSDLIETKLRDEKNNLESELRRLKDELSAERGKIRELAGEGARRAIQERSAAEQRYTAHFDQLSHDLTAQYDNVAKLQLELERQRREENDLKRELSMKNAAIDELKMELKNKSSTLQADLAHAHAEKASLEEELASARLAMERHQRQAKHEANRLNSEIQSLRQRLDRADADVIHSRRENLRLSEQIASLEKELNMKTLTPTSPDKTKRQQETSDFAENKHAKTVTELEKMIQSQNSLMEKLSSECRLLKDRLDDANSRHKKELATVQRQVATLGQSMQYQNTPDYSPAQATHTASADGNKTNSTTDPRSLHRRSDAPGDTDVHGQLAISSFGEHRLNNHYIEPETIENDSGQQSRTFVNPQTFQEESDTHANAAEITDSAADNREDEKKSVKRDLDNQVYERNVEYSDAHLNENLDYKENDYENQSYAQLYVEGQYPNYEQFDNQNPIGYQEGQYENYNQDPIYQNVEGYNQVEQSEYEDQIQYDAETVNQDVSSTIAEGNEQSSAELNNDTTENGTNNVMQIQS